MAIGCHTLVQHKPYFYKPVKEPPSLQTVLAKPVRTVLLDAVCWWMIQAGATWFDYIPLLDSCLPHGNRTCEIFAATGCCINDLLSRITKIPIVAWENQAGKGEVSDKCKKKHGTIILHSLGTRWRDVWRFFRRHSCILFFQRHLWAKAPERWCCHSLQNLCTSWLHAGAVIDATVL